MQAGEPVMPTDEVLEATLKSTFMACVRAMASEGPPPPREAGAPGFTQITEEVVAGGGAYYGRFRIDPLPPGKAMYAGNVFRRTLLRHDFFRCHAFVALRAHQRNFKADGERLVLKEEQQVKHEFENIPGVKESMTDVIRNVQRMAISRLPSPKLPLSAMAAETAGVESWRWSVRHFGPSCVQARDLEMVDSSTHYELPVRLSEPQYHLCQITSSSMLEMELEAVCCSEREWEESPAFLAYRKRLLNGGWLMVPPIFSPVLKVNYAVVRSEENPESKDEAVELEVWTRISTKPSTLVKTAAASLAAAIVNRQGLEYPQELADLLPGPEEVSATAGAWDNDLGPLPGEDGWDDLSAFQSVPGDLGLDNLQSGTLDPSLATTSLDDLIDSGMGNVGPQDEANNLPGLPGLGGGGMDLPDLDDF